MKKTRIHDSRLETNPGSLVGAFSSAPGALQYSVQPQDLLSDKFVESAPRMKFEGRMMPSLSGIPLVAKLGQGGMGAVYYGFHPRLHLEVAIKVIPLSIAAQNPEMRSRFMREARVAASIKSPNLISVSDVGQDSGMMFMVMEFVNGASAAGLLRQAQQVGQPALTEKIALDICIAVSEGLAAAHRKGVIHRDIKPANIMVPKCDDGEKFNFPASKLVDLGLARREGQQRATVEAFIGTVGYAPPEQYSAAAQASTPADVFAIGATLYALLAGHPPFAGYPEKSPPVLENISPATSKVITKALSLDPADRYPDAQEIHDALAEARRMIASPKSLLAIQMPAQPSPGAAAKLNLKCRGGSLDGKSFSFDAGPVIIGRGSVCQIAFTKSDTLVSKRHCEIYFNERGVWIRDLESKNGTLIGGQRITMPAALKMGTIIRLGPMGPELLIELPVKEAAPAELQLTCVKGVLAGQSFKLGELPISLGRASSNDIKLDATREQMVSGRHCEISWQNNTLMLSDFGSKYGTWVNGVRIERPTPIGSGTVIRLGKNGPEFLVSGGEELLGTLEEEGDAKGWDSESIHGSLVHVGIPSVLVMLDIEKVNGEMIVISEGSKGRLCLFNGRVIQAELNSSSGKFTDAEAVYAVLGWSTGTFDFRPCDIELEDRIKMPTTSLLAEGARRMKSTD